MKGFLFFYRRIKVVFVITIVLSFVAGSSYAALDQSIIDSATRESDRDFREEMHRGIRRPPEKSPLIDAAEERDTGKKFLIKSIRLEGVESLSPYLFTHLISQYENKKVGIKGLQNLARKIQREYLKENIIATCIVPPQKLDDGTVVIKVIEGRMGKLNIEGNRFYRDRVLEGYWHIPEGMLFQYDKMLRSLDLMNENPDRRVKSRLSAGEEPGTTNVTLVSETTFPIHATASFDKEGAVSTGRNRWGLGGKDNNFLGFDDTLVTGTVFSDDSFSFYAYHSVPVSRVGTNVTYGYSHSKSSPKKELTEYGINSWTDNYSLFVYQDLYARDGLLIEGYMGMDLNDKVTKTNDGVYNKDRLRIVRLGGSLTTDFYGGIFYVRPEISQGLNIFGASGRSDLSSRGASSNFFKANLHSRYSRPLPFNTKVVSRFKVQIAGEKLTPQEEMALGGINSVRGYPNGDFYADNGVQANLDFLFPAFFVPEAIKMPFSERSLKDELTGILFVDYAYGAKRGNIPSEKRDNYMVGIGIGARLRLYDQLFLRFAFGFPVGNKTITEKCDTRWHLAIDFEDKFLDHLFNKKEDIGYKTFTDK